MEMEYDLYCILEWNYFDQYIFSYFFWFIELMYIRNLHFLGLGITLWIKLVNVILIDIATPCANTNRMN